MQSLLKHHGEYWGQVWLGLSAGGVALIPKDSEASRKRVQSVLDAAAQVWAGSNLADSMRNLKPLDALKKLANVIEREAAGVPLDDNSVWRIRQKALKDKGIFIRDEFQRGGPDLRELK